MRRISSSRPRSRDSRAHPHGAYRCLLANFFFSRLEQASSSQAPGRALRTDIPREHSKLVQTYQHDPIDDPHSSIPDASNGCSAGPAGPENAVRRRRATRERDRASFHAGISLHSSHWPTTGMKAIQQHRQRRAQPASPTVQLCDDVRLIAPLSATAALTRARPRRRRFSNSYTACFDKLPAENRCISDPLYRILLATDQNGMRRSEGPEASRLRQSPW